jgi:hypothetical protein
LASTSFGASIATAPPLLSPFCTPVAVLMRAVMSNRPENSGSLVKSQAVPLVAEFSGGLVDGLLLGSQHPVETIGLELALTSDSLGCSAVAEAIGPMDPLLKQSIHNSLLSGPLSSCCMDLDLPAEDPSPLLCCPTIKSRGKVGAQSSDWVLQLIKVFSHIVGLSCDGYEGKLSALFEDIITFGFV